MHESPEIASLYKRQLSLSSVIPEQSGMSVVLVQNRYLSLISDRGTVSSKIKAAELFLIAFEQFVGKDSLHSNIKQRHLIIVELACKLLSEAIVILDSNPKKFKRRFRQIALCQDKVAEAIKKSGISSDLQLPPIKHSVFNLISLHTGYLIKAHKRVCKITDQVVAGVDAVDHFIGRGVDKISDAIERVEQRKSYKESIREPNEIIQEAPQEERQSIE